MLQLCRPLSGAVIVRCVYEMALSQIFRFNCAAPFRERLSGLGLIFAGRYDVLQLCRPLSGAVI